MYGFGCPRREMAGNLCMAVEPHIDVWLSCHIGVWLSSHRSKAAPGTLFYAKYTFTPNRVSKCPSPKLPSIPNPGAEDGPWKTFKTLNLRRLGAFSFRANFQLSLTRFLQPVHRMCSVATCYNPLRNLSCVITTSLFWSPTVVMCSFHQWCFWLTQVRSQTKWQLSVLPRR
jgi:hypothetical protein